MKSLDKKIALIRNDKSRGATELALAAVSTLKDICRMHQNASVEALDKDLAEAARELSAARPSINAIRTGLLLALSRLRDKRSVKECLAEIERFERELSASSEKCAKNASRVLRSGMTVMTNSLSSTILKTAHFSKRKRLRFIVVESRPLFEGRQTAKRLSRMGFAATLISDAACSIYINDCDLVLVGADTIPPDGSVVNKAGTKLIALAAYEKKIPFYCVAQKIKILSERKYFKIEEKEPGEISKPLVGVTIRNPYFDITPAKYITGIITEDGLMGRPAIRRFACKLKHLKIS